MTKAEYEMMNAAGLTEADFRSKPGTEQRLDIVEHRTEELEITTDDLTLLMAEMIGG